MFQYSVGDAVMPDAITYGQDCSFTFLTLVYIDVAAHGP